MEFDPSFALLKKFTPGLPENVSQRQTITVDEVIAVAIYLGVKPPSLSLEEQKTFLERELIKQNAFLNDNLQRSDVDRCAEYLLSGFIREVVMNNREPKTKKS